MNLIGKISLAGIVAVLVSALIIVAGRSENDLSAQGGMKLGDAEFARQLCTAWNNSKLPRLLGDEDATRGSDWINIDTGISRVPAGYQKIVSGRHDCKGWPRFELVIVKQPDGSAKCISAGRHNGRDITWQFLPTTENWFNYAKSFGMGAFAGLWKNGMKGKYWTAYGNRDNFKIFFQLAAGIGKNADIKTGCTKE